MAEAILDSARRLGLFTKASLAEASDAGYRRVVSWIKAAEADGRLRRVSVGPRARIGYALVEAPGELKTVAPSRVETPAGNMWTAMRGLVSFTAVDIAAHASTERVRVDAAAAAAYCRALLRAGYLRAVHKAVPGQRPAVYRLVRNTGPRPPRERRVTGVWDENTGGWVWLPGAAP
jgi:hypothetical protein